MPQPYLGEIRIFPINYAPDGWFWCDGRLLPIEDYEALFAVIGTTYGGDGQSNFALPDLRGRVPIHAGASQGPGVSQYSLGQQGGVDAVSLTQEQVPVHFHFVSANVNPANLAAPSGARSFARTSVGSSRVDLQACKLEYSIVSPK